jgi:hypothetical protein
MAVGCALTTHVGRAALACTLALSIGGCSTVSGLSGAPRAGYQGDGTYVMSAEQQALGCRELQARQVGLQERMQQLPEKAVKEMQELPKTVARAWARLIGSSDQGAPSLAEYNEAKAEHAALNDSLSRKGCTGVETASIKH